jgi:hypothetical protein
LHGLVALPQLRHPIPGSRPPGIRSATDR